MKFLNKILLSLLLVFFGKLVNQDINYEFNLEQDTNKKPSDLSSEIIEAAKNLNTEAFEIALKNENSISENNKTILKTILFTEYTKLIKQLDLIAPTNGVSYTHTELSERKKLDLAILMSAIGFGIAFLSQSKFIKTLTALGAAGVYCFANYQLHLLDKPHLAKEEKNKQELNDILQKMKKVMQMVEILDAHPTK